MLPQTCRKELNVSCQVCVRYTKRITFTVAYMISVEILTQIFERSINFEGYLTQNVLPWNNVRNVLSYNNVPTVKTKLTLSRT